MPSHGVATVLTASGLNRREIKSPINGKRFGSTVISSDRLSTTLPMMARDLINSISVAEGDSLPSMLLISEKPSKSFFFASTCI
ncbi:hypothetical protein D3C75_355460 [compost metagenome]